MNKIVFLSAVLILSLFSCSHKKESTLLLKDERKPVATPQINSFGKEISQLSQKELDQSLYGRFFYDRAEYYIIHRPSNKLMGRDILKATLYYMDGQLYKVKYLLDVDIANDLVNRHRQFKVKPLDEISRSVLKNQAVAFKVDTVLSLNSNLRNYELTWNRGEKEIRWRTGADGHPSLYEYSESLPDYRKKFRELEYFESKF
jgi:hypothetical protein